MNARKIFQLLAKGYRKIKVEKETKEISAENVGSLHPTIFETILKIVSETKKTEKKEVTTKKEKIEGIEIPEIVSKKVKLRKAPLEERKKEIVYPLIPRNPSKEEPILSYARIYWDKKKNKYVYNLIEPPLTSRLKTILKRVKELLEEKVDIDLSKISLVRGKEYLRKKIDEIVSYFNFILTPTERKIIEYYVQREFLGFGKIDALMKDPNIEDISCDGVGIPIFVFHRNPEIGSVETNIVFETPEELDSFVIRLAQLCGKSISIAQPLVDGTLPDGSRLQATLGTDIARRGSNFTIRKFSESPLTPIHLIKYGTVDVKTMTYLWMAVDFGRSVLVSGGTASGKTTMLNVLSLFIRPDKKIVSIEDTPEIRLPHPHWISSVARVPISTGKRGEVDMFDLLKESLRQRPDYIVLGEVRGKEAYILFQQIATGHPSLATVHAEDIMRLVDRLISPPISLPPQLIESLDLVVFMHRMKIRNKNVRRVTEIDEIIKFDEEKKEIKYNKIFELNTFEDRFEVKNKSLVLRKISKLSGLDEKEITEEFKRRYLVLQWMAENNIVNFEDVYRVISLYYSNPNKLISIILNE